MMERVRISDCNDRETDIRRGLPSPKEHDGMLREVRLGFITPKERKTLIREAKANFLKFNVHWFYFKEGLSQQEIADKLGVSVHTIYRCFKKEEWTPRNSTKKVSFEHEEVCWLYYDQGLTQQEVADRLGVSLSTVYRHFRKHAMQPHRIISRDKLDNREIHRLHFDERLTQKEIGERLSVCEHTISRIFRDEGWTPWGQIKYFGEKERELAKKESKEKVQMKIVALRKHLFGTSCQICTEARKIAIHRKDGSRHNPDDLWRISNLRTINPDEYAAVCVPCHRGVHWMIRTSNQNWEQIKSQTLSIPISKRKASEPLSLPDESEPSSAAYLKIKHNFQGSEEETRRALFGDICHICGSRYDEKRLFLHRKDGRPHNSSLSTKEVFFRTLDPKEWVFLCYSDHRGVHWAKRALGLTWDNLMMTRNGAEGEI